jgi:hypothetical protein
MDGMSEIKTTRLEDRLYGSAQTFEYPPTPNFASITSWTTLRQAKRRPVRGLSTRLAWTVAIFLVVLGGLLAVPPVRAQILEFIQIGAIRIFLRGPSPAPTPLGTTPAPSSGAGLPTSNPPPTVVLQATPTPIASYLSLAGETSLAEAKSQAGFEIRLPGYPEDLGAPDLVFLQDMSGPAVLLVWLKSGNEEEVELSLLEMGPGTFAGKGVPEVIQETTVNGHPALWTQGPHLLQFKSGYDLVNLVVKGNLLIWEDVGITYRLESDLSMAEAIKIAESLNEDHE